MNNSKHQQKFRLIIFIMGVYLSEPNKEKHWQEGSCNAYSFVSAQMQGWRKTMEDAAIHNCNIGDGNGLFAVFDGHGGFQVSKYVAEIFTKLLKENSFYQIKKFKEALDDTFKRVDELIQSPEGQRTLNQIKYGSDTPAHEKNSQFIGGSVGCTANVLLITQTHYFIANSGDSRSVLCREGQAVAFSEDHKPQNPIEQERIRKAGGKISMGRVNGGLNLSRSFGDFDYKRSPLPYDQQMITCKPDIKEFKREKGDEFVLMGCDGIWQNYVENNQGLIDIVRQDLKKQKNNHKKIVEVLLERLIATDTMSGLGCDNMTAILIVFK